MAEDTFISCYPNAGLPNPMSDTGFDETPEVTSRLVHVAAEGWSTSWAAAAAPRPTTLAPLPRRSRLVPARKMFYRPKFAKTGFVRKYGPSA